MQALTLTEGDLNFQGPLLDHGAGEFNRRKAGGPEGSYGGPSWCTCCGEEGVAVGCTDWL